uniref:Uncharacterized protein n=1 Tax=Kalanchoe fedtschenkoi TaxID=63787 RepID=A0A7N0TC25_KALFE
MECKYHRKVECGDVASDDDFYAEMRRQILQLTAEEDEEQAMPTYQMKRSSSVYKDSFTRVHSGKSYRLWLASWENSETACSSAPVWLTNLWRCHASVGSTTGGTGVFIPHIVKSRRKHIRQLDEVF